MKVFWSWQSDHAGRISRHFVRDALREALAQLSSSPDIEMPVREAQLDQDRQGVPGSPDLARVIMEKIDSSHAFVADVTPVGQTKSKPPKKLMNSNVAIELGYSLATVTDRGLVMILNEHYGSRNDLPFDLQHKAGPVMYQLAPNATKNEIKQEQTRLAGVLKEYLKPILNEAAQLLGPTEPVAQFQATPAMPDNPARYFEADTVLMESNSQREEWKLTGPSGPLLYLRVIPSAETKPLQRAEAVDLLRTGLRPLYFQHESTLYNANEFGALALHAHYDNRVVLSAAQLFLNREIWGFDSLLARQRQGTTDGLPTKSVEQTFAVCLQNYVWFAQEKLGLQPPFRIEAGGFPLKGYVIHMPGDFFERQWGPILNDHVVWSGSLDSTEPEVIDEVLLNIFQTFFDFAGTRRPQGLYNFPGDKPGSLPAGE